MAMSSWMKIKQRRQNRRLELKNEVRPPKKFLLSQILQGCYLSLESHLALCFFSKFPFSPPAIPFIIESCVEMKIDSRSKISNRLQSWHKKDKRGWGQHTAGSWMNFYPNTCLLFTKKIMCKYFLKTTEFEYSYLKEAIFQLCIPNRVHKFIQTA